MRIKLFLFFVFVSIQSVWSQSISGIIKNTKGEPLPFASLWVSNLNRGTLANENGEFLMNLGTGEHEITFRFLGHVPHLEKVVFQKDSKDKKFEIRLIEQSISLKEVQVGALKEDPAILMMRRMIAMAPFHLQEIRNYTAKAYIKGTGKVNSISPLMNKLIGKKMEKEAGIKAGSTYVLEAINVLEYNKPNQLKERVISNRNNLPAQLKAQDSPNLRIAQTNFYRSKVWGSLISPLSSNAFSYYNFAYLGSFKLGEQTISKIQIRPKMISDDLLSGTMNIVEDTWSIYSLDLLIKTNNTSNHMYEQCANFNGVWMPVQYEVSLAINMMGIDASFKYITQIKQYDIHIDPKFLVKPQIIDERVQKGLAKEIDQEKIKNSNQASNSFSQEITRKKLRKALQQISKEEKQKVTSEKKLTYQNEYDFEIDSLASKKSEDYWEKEREVPLVESEIKGYKEADSIYAAGAKKRLEDSVRNLPKFKFYHLWTGKSYDYQKKQIGNKIHLDGIGIYYSALDGLYLTNKLEFIHANSRQNFVNISGDLRYSTGLNRFNYSIDFQKSYDGSRQYIRFRFGDEIQQKNTESIISEKIASLYALFHNQNIVKFYENQFVNLTYRYRLNSKFLFSTILEYRQRNDLVNTKSKGIFNLDGKEFESNDPLNLEMGPTKISNDQQLFYQFGIKYQPFSIWRRFNQYSYLGDQNKLVAELKYKQAQLDNSFSSIEFSIKQKINLERFGELSYFLGVNTFIKKPSNFLDFKHYSGNEILFIGKNSSNFLALPYYLMSTAGNSIWGNIEYHPRKLLLNRIPALYMYGIRESLKFNFIRNENSPKSKLYQELSYGFDGVLGGFGIDIVKPFGDWIPQDYKVRIRVPL